MAIASGVAITAMSYLAVDAVVDVSPSGIARRIEVAQASLIGAASSQYQRAFAVHAWAAGSDHPAPWNAQRRDKPLLCRAEPVI